MSDDAKPAYLRGRGSRGRGSAYPPAPDDRNIQRPGRHNKGWRNQDTPVTDNRSSRNVATSDSRVGGKT